MQCVSMESDDELADSSCHEQDLVENVFVFITRGCYPVGASNNQKQVVRNKAKKFSTQDRHDSMTFSPFELKFGRHAYLPVDVDPLTSTPEQSLERWQESRQFTPVDVEQLTTRHKYIAFGRSQGQNQAGTGEAE